MDWFTGIIVYLLIWWVVIFAVLPFGLKRDETGKPENPRLASKLLITTVVSFGVWIAIYLLIDSNIISFRDMSMEMIREERQS